MLGDFFSSAALSIFTRCVLFFHLLRSLFSLAAISSFTRCDLKKIMQRRIIVRPWLDDGFMQHNF